MTGLFGSLFGLNPSSLFGGGNLTGKDFLRAQTPKNTLLDSMSPEVAGMFQEQFGINPMIDPTTAATAATGAANPLLALSAIQGLLSPQETQMLPMVQQQATPGLNIQPQNLAQFYGGILGGN